MSVDLPAPEGPSSACGAVGVHGRFEGHRRSPCALNLAAPGWMHAAQAPCCVARRLQAGFTAPPPLPDLHLSGVGGAVDVLEDPFVAGVGPVAAAQRLPLQLDALHLGDRALRPAAGTRAADRAGCGRKVQNRGRGFVGATPTRACVGCDAVDACQGLAQEHPGTALVSMACCARDWQRPWLPGLLSAHVRLSCAAVAATSCRFGKPCRCHQPSRAPRRAELGLTSARAGRERRISSLCEHAAVQATRPCRGPLVILVLTRLRCRFARRLAEQAPQRAAKLWVDQQPRADDPEAREYVCQEEYGHPQGHDDGRGRARVKTRHGGDAPRPQWPVCGAPDSFKAFSGFRKSFLGSPQG
jgi:hypothetical protein